MTKVEYHRYLHSWRWRIIRVIVLALHQGAVEGRRDRARGARRAGLDTSRIAPHRAFRASPISAAAHADENPALISKRARHKSFETTKKYIDRNAGDDVRVGRAAY